MDVLTLFFIDCIAQPAFMEFASKDLKVQITFAFAKVDGKEKRVTNVCHIGIVQTRMKMLVYIPMSAFVLKTSTIQRGCVKTNFSDLNNQNQIFAHHFPFFYFHSCTFSIRSFETNYI